MPGQRKGKYVAKFRNSPCFVVKMHIKIPTLADTIVSNKGRYFGAGGRTRTGTLSPAVDFESTTSTNSITPAGVSLAFINNRRWLLSPLRLPVAVPKISCSLFAHEILTAATRSPPLTPPLAAVGSLPNCITPAGVDLGIIHHLF